MRRWYRKKTIFGGVLILVLYFLFRNRKSNVKYSALISNAEPADIWEFVSDFGNMKTINPTILNFSIESESGNYNHWKYRVYYTEYLSQFPSLVNFAWADFEIKTLSENTYGIYSKHKTCFFTSYNCFHTESTFLAQPTKNEHETRYTEFITYECPAILSSFCKNEVLYQRNKIRNSLQNIFKNRKGVLK